MRRVRITRTAQHDISEVLAWSEQHFGPAAARRYESLISTAINDIASAPTGVGTRDRSDLGAEVRSWHLQLSRDHVSPSPVRKPRHMLFYLVDADFLVILRVLHDAMAVGEHINPADTR